MIMVHICQPVLCLLHVLRRWLYGHEFILSCVGVELCCWGCISQRVTTRGRDLGRGDKASVCATARVAAGSLRSLSLDYHCCTHCWGEKNVDSLILPVGCFDRGKSPCTLLCLCYAYVMKENEVSESCLAGLVLCECGDPNAVWRK